MIAEFFLIRQIKSYIFYEGMSLNGMETLQSQIDKGK